MVAMHSGEHSGMSLAPGEHSGMSLAASSTALCPSGMDICHDGSCHHHRAISLGVCTLGCPLGYRRCADGSCLAADVLALCAPPLVLMEVKEANMSVDVSIAEVPVVIRACSDGTDLATLRLSRLALGEDTAHLTIAPLAHALALAALPLAYIPTGGLRSPAFRIVSSAARLARPVPITLRVQPRRRYSDLAESNAADASGLCLASLINGHWRCVDRHLTSVTDLRVHGEVNHLGTFAVIDQRADPLPTPPLRPPPPSPDPMPHSLAPPGATAQPPSVAFLVVILAAHPVLSVGSLLLMALLITWLTWRALRRQPAEKPRRPSFSDWAEPGESDAGEDVQQAAAPMGTEPSREHAIGAAGHGSRQGAASAAALAAAPEGQADGSSSDEDAWPTPMPSVRGEHEDQQTRGR